MQNRAMIFSLGRKGGFLQYASHIIKYLDMPYTLYQSTYAIEEVDDNAIKIKTYKDTKLSFVLNTIFRLPFLLVKIYRQSRRYDVLFLPYFHFWNLAFILIFRFQKKQVVIIEHDGIIHIGDGYPLEQTLINLCMKYADKIIFLSDFVRDRSHIAKGKQTYIIPHGIYTFDGLKTTPKPYCKKPNILFFGRVNKYKGIKILIEAIAKLPSHLYNRLIIAGKSATTYDASALPKDKLCIIDKFLDQDEISNLFNQSHILVMPYIEASQSGVASLAIANCMPTICTDVGGIKGQFMLNRGGGMMGFVRLFASLMPLASYKHYCNSQAINTYMKCLALAYICDKES